MDRYLTLTPHEIAALPRTAGDPRVPGGIYWCGYWRRVYTVIAVERRRNGEPITITEQAPEERDRGVTRTHCTRWDYHADRVLHTPQETP